jgi:hypothetical protein
LKSDSTRNLISKYYNLIGDQLHLEPKLEDYDLIEEELNLYLEFLEKFNKDDLSYNQLVFYFMQLTPSFTYKSNQLSALYIYSHFVKEEAKKFGLSDNDLFYTRKYLDDDDLYSKDVKNHVYAIINTVKERASQPEYKISLYFMLAHLFLEYIKLKDNKMKKALIYKMYNDCFERVKMISLYGRSKSQAVQVKLHKFDVHDDIHRGWLSDIKVK